MQAPIAVVSALVGAAAWWTTGDPLWAVGAVIMIANWPYTLVAIMPTNHLLEVIASGGDRDTRVEFRHGAAPLNSHAGMRG